jgi:hypothetical protein
MQHKIFLFPDFINSRRRIQHPSLPLLFLGKAKPALKEGTFLVA